MFSQNINAEFGKAKTDFGNDSDYNYISESTQHCNLRI